MCDLVISGMCIKVSTGIRLVLLFVCVCVGRTGPSLMCVSAESSPRFPTAHHKVGTWSSRRQAPQIYVTMAHNTFIFT